jgi:chromosome segregation ATPase
MNKYLNKSVDEERDLGKSSILRDLSSSSQGSSSKAVLAALRALQDKISRLEAEKAQAQDETKQLRLQIQNQEIEFDHLKQKEKLNVQKSINEARNSYEQILSEKKDLEIRVSKLEERNRELRNHSEELLEKIRNLDNEKHQQEYRYKELESRYLHLEVQIDRAQQREKSKLISYPLI